MRKLNLGGLNFPFSWKRKVTQLIFCWNFTVLVQFGLILSVLLGYFCVIRKVMCPILGALLVELQIESKMGSLLSMGLNTNCPSTSPQTVSTVWNLSVLLYSNDFLNCLRVLFGSQENWGKEREILKTSEQRTFHFCNVHIFIIMVSPNIQILEFHGLCTVVVL